MASDKLIAARLAKPLISWTEVKAVVATDQERLNLLTFLFVSMSISRVSFSAGSTVVQKHTLGEMGT